MPRQLTLALAVLAAIGATGAWHLRGATQRDAAVAEAAEARRVAAVNVEAVQRLREEARRTAAALAERDARLADLARQTASLKRRIADAEWTSASPAGRTWVDGLRQRPADD